MDALTLILATTAIAGLYMAWSIGANDVANAMGTSVGSGALTMRRAIVVAAVFELGGALLSGGRVSETIATGIVDFEAFPIDQELLAGGMACALIGAALWIQVATAFALPVSTTHSIVGAVLGFAIAAGAGSQIDWVMLGGVFLSWFVSPLLGAAVAFVVYRWLLRVVFDTEHSGRAAANVTPLFSFLITATLAALLLTERRPPLSAGLSFERALLPSIGIGAIAAAATWLYGRRLLRREEGGGAEQHFGSLQIISACFVAFAHGSNDVANAVGPVAVAFGALAGDGASITMVPTNVLMIGACGIVLGLSTYGFRVIATIGRAITELTPSRGFAAEFAAALTIVASSALALPISTTNVIVGAVVGVGLNRSIGALNTQVLRGIGMGWLVAVPASAITAALLTLVLRALL